MLKNILSVIFLRLFSIILFGFLVSCNQDDLATPEFESTGEIIGPDVRLCICCGGWFIRLDGQEELYNFRELPENSDINLDGASFPIKVNLNWSEDTLITCGSWIIIEDIALIE